MELNSIFFHKYRKLAAGFCPKNVAFAGKIMALPPTPSSPGSYAYADGEIWLQPA